MEALKKQAPFWKKERLASGEVRWVESNSDGYQAK
jgi:molybdopterin synthase catalytic subunit